ncbi:hypothetical protein GGR50DRAFT_698649 [Xylaria sp. CBS 124048]|nr:hypothetical protein GGR50DRAFT_698649 [Xylaria sp. CBS 124048]
MLYAYCSPSYGSHASSSAGTAGTAGAFAITNVDVVGRAQSDRESLLLDAIEKDKLYDVNFDELGLRLSEKATPGARSAAKRTSKFSFIEESTEEELDAYTSDEIATILAQRENVLDVLAREHKFLRRQRLYNPRGPDGRLTLKPFSLDDYPPANKQWVPRVEDECQAKYCQKCRPSSVPRSYLSLNAIVNGEVPATAATGFGFHFEQTRPIVDAELMKNIGLRAVPRPQAKSASSPSGSRCSLSELMDRHTVDSNTGARQPTWSPPPLPTWIEAIQQEDGTLMFSHNPFIFDRRIPDTIHVGELPRPTLDSSLEAQARSKGQYVPVRFGWSCELPYEDAMRREILDSTGGGHGQQGNATRIGVSDIMTQV